MKRSCAIYSVALLVSVLAMAGPACAAVSTDALEDLAQRYYQFTYGNDPVGSTDNGLHLADDRLADLSSQAQQRYLLELRRFRSELATKIPPADASVHEQVNYLLLRAAIEGDWWRITYLQSPARDPSIYEGECSNGIFSLLKKPFASAEVRARDAIGRLRACPGVLEQGKQNLTNVVREFAQVASEDVASGDSLYTRSLDSLDAGIRPQTKAELQSARSDALAALHAYKTWIDGHLSSWREGGFAVGKDQYSWYLRRVLLLPYTPTDLTALANTELARDRALEQCERNRDQALPAAHQQPAFKSKTAFFEILRGPDRSRARVSEEPQHRDGSLVYWCLPHRGTARCA